MQKLKLLITLSHHGLKHWLQFDDVIQKPWVEKKNITPSLSVWYPIVHHQVSQMRATKFWRHIPGGFNHMRKWSYKREEMIQLIGNDNFYPTCFPEIRQSHRSFFGSTKTKKTLGFLYDKNSLGFPRFLRTSVRCHWQLCINHRSIRPSVRHTPGKTKAIECRNGVKV